MSKFRLILDDDYEFLAFGMSCHLKDYRVAWHLNRALRKDFRRENVDIETRSGHMESFAKYTFRDHDAHLHYLLLSNHNEETYLLKGLKEYDYFLLIEGYLDIFRPDEFQVKLDAIEGIQLITPLDTEAFKPIQFALFEE